MNIFTSIRYIVCDTARYQASLIRCKGRSGQYILALMLCAFGLSPSNVMAQSVLEEIVVTAQKREQNLQDVSVAVTAIPGSQLEDGVISDLESLQFSVPSISIGDTFGFSNLFLRGLGLNTSFPNVDPSVTLYSDGAIISQPAAQLFSFFDLERIEVLRGPQGTLYGRNSTGGLINLITKKPTDRLEGRVSVNAGNFQLFQIEAGVGGPIAENWLARVAVYSKTHEGFGINEATGNDVHDRNRQALRAQLHYTGFDTVDVSFVAEYGRENDSSNGFLAPEITFPDFLTDADPTNDRFFASGAGGFATGGERNYSSNVDPLNIRETVALTNTIQWQVNDNFTIKNTINFRSFDALLVQDLDVSAVINSSIEFFDTDSDVFAEELQFTYSTERFSGIFGLYYFDEDLGSVFGIGRSATGADEFDQSAVGNGRRVFTTGDGSVESWAAFWSTTFDLTEKFSIRAGGRYTEDERSVDGSNFIFVGPPGGEFQITPPAFVGTETFDDYTSDFGIEFRPNADNLLYYTYSEGFKAGTAQLVPPTTPTEFVRPETITSHEIGLKSTLLGGSMVVNLAAFSYEVEDLQLDQTLPGGPAGFSSVFQNATSQDGTGVELEVYWSPTENFRLNGSATWLDTEFGSFVTVNPATLEFEDIAGNPARQAPELTAAVHGEYDWSTASGGLFTLAADVGFKDDQRFSEFDTPRLSQESYTIADLRLTYQFPNQNFRAGVWVKNLSDELVEGGAFAISTGRVIARTYLPPRTYGVSFNYHFE